MGTIPILALQYSNFPTFHYSIVYSIHLVSDVLREPFQWQRMAEAFGLGEIVRGSAHRREL
jgi:hypothetical protein